MIEKEVVVKSVTGLHARPGSELVEIALTYKSSIKLVKEDGEVVDAKEVLDVLTANINCGDKLKVQVIGEDQVDALKEICTYIETKEG